MSETISKCKINRMFWEWKKKRNVMISKYTFLLFFSPLESAGFCYENSSFGPEHETVGIEFGSCAIQPFFSTYPSTSWHIFSTTWRKTLRRFMPISPMTSHMLSVNASCTGLCPQPSLAVGMQKACLNTPGRAQYGRVPFQRTLQHGQRQGLAALFCWRIHWRSQLSSGLGVQYFLCSAPGQWSTTVP